jgi:sugar phosphate isomerase/epimerase
MGTIPVGLQLYTVREQLAEDPVATIKAVAEIGYTGVEGGAPPGMSNADYLALLEDVGMKLIGSGCQPSDLHDDLDGLIDNCQELGINTLMTGIGREVRAEGADWKAVVSKLGEGCEKADDAGLRILYHNHAFEFEAKVDGMYGLDYLLENIPESSIGAEIDVYWVDAGGEDPVAYINKYAHRLPYLHLKDRTRGKDHETCPFAEVGYGTLDWDGIFGAAEAAGIEWYIVEQDRWLRPPIECARMSFEFLKLKGIA